MRDRLNEFGHATEVALVTFTDPGKASAYRFANQLPFRMLIDRERQAYAAFGLGRGSIARVYGWKAARRYLEIFRSEGLSGLARPTEDTLQLGGDFVIGPDGSLAYGFWSQGPDDRPDVDDLIRAVRRIDT